MSHVSRTSMASMDPIEKNAQGLFVDERIISKVLELPSFGHALLFSRKVSLLPEGKKTTFSFLLDLLNMHMPKDQCAMDHEDCEFCSWVVFPVELTNIIETASHVFQLNVLNNVESKIIVGSHENKRELDFPKKYLFLIDEDKPLKLDPRASFDYTLREAPFTPVGVEGDSLILKYQPPIFGFTLVCCQTESEPEGEITPLEFLELWVSFIAEGFSQQDEMGSRVSIHRHALNKDQCGERLLAVQLSIKEEKSATALLQDAVVYLCMQYGINLNYSGPTFMLKDRGKGTDCKIHFPASERIAWIQENQPSKHLFDAITAFALVKK